MATEAAVSKLGAVAPPHAAPPPPEGQQDGVTWPRDGAAFPVASPTGRGLSRPRAPHEPSGLRLSPKPRSGSEKRQRIHVARIRLDDAERAKLAERASASGLDVGAYLRACALGTAGVRARRRARVDRELLARTNADLNRVGNNLNQIAHALNSGRDPPQFVAEAMDELRGVLAALRRVVGYDSEG